MQTRIGHVLTEASSEEGIESIRDWLLDYQSRKPEKHRGLRKVVRDGFTLRLFYYGGGKSYNVSLTDEYYQSEEWDELRRQVIERDDYRCRLCDAAGVNDLIVHHKTYKRFGKEYLTDLLTLCNGCNTLVHDNVEIGGER